MAQGNLANAKSRTLEEQSVPRRCNGYSRLQWRFELDRGCQLGRQGGLAGPQVTNVVRRLRIAVITPEMVVNR